MRIHPLLFAGAAVLAILAGCSSADSSPTDGDGGSGGAAGAGGGGEGGAATDGGSGGAGGGVDLCAAVICVAPPDPECLHHHTLRKYSAPGVCAGGHCVYRQIEIDCDNGCYDGHCIADNPCEGVTCDTPPPPECADETTLVSYDGPGECADAVCIYPSTMTPCEHGCDAGACIEDLCAGVTCTEPPPATCLDANTLRTFDANGACDPSDGSCSYPPIDMTCANGCDSGACLTP